MSPGPDETLDRLAGDWQILQLRRGHRFGSDDLLTAWLAWTVAPDARRLLDLGSGIGSVGLLTLWKMAAESTLTTVEVQALSYGLACRTVAGNGLEHRVTLRNRDLRDPAAVPERAAFDLVTGSPPYFPLGTAVVSAHPQRAAARMELHGDVMDYAAVAARALAPQGWFCFVHAAADPRPERAIAAAGLVLRHRVEVFFRANQRPTIALYAAAFSGDRQDLPPIVMRDADGVFTPAYMALRREMGAVSQGG